MITNYFFTQVLFSGGGGGGDYGGYDLGGGIDLGEHHHETKSVTVVKKVAVPYPVTKEIPVPVEKTVHVPIKVPVPQPYPVEKTVRLSL